MIIRYSMTPVKILIVDDEPDICEILQFNLEKEGYEVQVAEAPIQLEDPLPDLILIDVMMTPKSGFEWAAELKSDSRTEGIPLIFCTAKTLEEDISEGFAIGSDDYICKPFRISEVKARVNAVLRRTYHSAEKPNDAADKSNTIRYEGLILNLDSKECSVDGEPIAFTKIEFEILVLLLSHRGQVFSRETILQRVWPNGTIVLDRTVDVNMARIRKKIGPYSEHLQSKFGYGYLFR